MPRLLDEKHCGTRRDIQLPVLGECGDPPFLKKVSRQSIEFGGISHGRGKERKTMHPIRTVFLVKWKFCLRQRASRSFRKLFNPTCQTRLTPTEILAMLQLSFDVSADGYTGSGLLQTNIEV